MKTYICVYIGAVLIAVVLTPLVIWMARRIGALDRPNARSVHKRPIPRIGGVAIFLSAMIPVAALPFLNNRIGEHFARVRVELITLLISAALIFVVGLVDDLRGLSARFKFAAQALAAGALCVAGIRINSIGITGEWEIRLLWLACPVTMFWVAGITNAVNLSDGLDGLAAGVSAIACAVIAIFALHNSMIHDAASASQSNDVMMALFALALLGSLTGFLIFNFNPAKIFLGDSGSMFLGFILAVMSIWTQRKGATMVALLIPVIALGVPILDTTLSFLRRLARRQNPFKADREHLHHRLLGLGLSHRNAVFTLYTVSAVFALGALALLDNDTTHRAIVLATVAMVVFILVRKIGGLKGHGLTQQSEDHFRDGLRAAARQIRDAGHAEQAWGALVDFVPQLRCDELRLSLRTEAEPQRDELRENVFRWRRDEDRAWRLDGSKPLAHLSRLPLEDNGVNFGELLVLGTNQSTLEQQVALQLLREAVIDFALRRRAESKVTGELASNVVRLAKS